MKMKKTLKNIVISTALVGSFMNAACNKEENANAQLDRLFNKTTFVETSERVIIEPYYNGENQLFMDGIVVTKYTHGDGSKIPGGEIVNKYARGSPEYEVLRPLLTVKRSK